MTKIAVAGLGYVGLSNAVLLAQHNTVVAIDLDGKRVEAVNSRKAPIEDSELERYLASVKLDLRATIDPLRVYFHFTFSKERASRIENCAPHFPAKRTRL